MTYQFVIGPVAWEYRTEDLCFTAKCGPIAQNVRWDDVLSAGLSPKRAIVLPPDFPTGVLPGLGTLARRAEQLTATTQHLWMLRRIGRGRKLAVFNIPKEGEEQNALVSELRSRLADRWVNDTMDLLQVRRKFGISNRWIYPSVAMLMLVALFFVLAWQYVQNLRPVAIVMAIITIGSLIYGWLRRRWYGV
jgi:hypothetical protein